DNYAVNVGKNFFERFCCIWWLRGQRSLNRTGWRIWRYPQLFNVCAVISNPIGQPMQLLAEFFRWRVAWIVLHQLACCSGVCVKRRNSKKALGTSASTTSSIFAHVPLKRQI